MRTWIINASPLILLGKILDDLAARNCAEVFQFPAIGTLGILLKAKVAGLIPLLQPEIDHLLAVGSLLAPSVIQRALILAGEHV